MNRGQPCLLLVVCDMGSFFELDYIGDVQYVGGVGIARFINGLCLK